MKIVNDYNYFRSISFSRSLIHEMNVMSFFNTVLNFTPPVFIWGQEDQGLGPLNLDMPVSICLPGFA